MRKRQRKQYYFEPQTDEEKAPYCEHEGCQEKGYYKAPSRTGARVYKHFCLEHVKEYNASWNYYQHMNGADMEENAKLDSIWRRPTWSFQRKNRINSPYEIEDPLNILGFGGYARPKEFSTKGLTREQKKALETLELNYPFSVQELKRKYVDLVKKHHPDVNKGSKRSEEKIKKISEAYNALKGLAE